jgi:hypothetical protein
MIKGMAGLLALQDGGSDTHHMCRAELQQERELARGQRASKRCFSWYYLLAGKNLRAAGARNPTPWLADRVVVHG